MPASRTSWHFSFVGFFVWLVSRSRSQQIRTSDADCDFFLLSFCLFRRRTPQHRKPTKERNSRDLEMRLEGIQLVLGLIIVLLLHGGLDVVGLQEGERGG